MVAFGLSLLLHDLPLWLQIPIGGLVGCAISYGRIDDLAEAPSRDHRRGRDRRP
jgi:hypothetical protein